MLDPTPETQPAKRASVPPAVWLVYAAVTIILAVYWPTTWSMADKWYTNETYAHGLLVFPIFVWLVWRSRAAMSTVSVRPAWWAVPVVAGAGLVWLIGELAYVASVSQLALIVMVVAAIVAAGGTELSRVLSFPLLFLFFAVPFGDDLLPFLMNWTADFTIVALRWSGVPVYREGLHFVIPTGRWSVVEACSGIRYLIASLMVGVLFAHLTYRSWRRRILFVVVSAIVPILANGVRAYMIVMIGHLSNNKYAVGVDHLIYGWVFFGVVIFFMFWIGSWFREDASQLAASARSESHAPGPRFDRGALIAATGAVLVAMLPWRAMPQVLEWTVPEGSSTLVPISSEVGWSDAAMPADWMPSFKFATVTMPKGFASGGSSVGLVVSYYSNQRQGSEMISWENKVVSSSEKRWPLVTSRTITADLGGSKRKVRVSQIGQQGDRLTVWHWYWVGGYTTTSEHVAKALLAWNKLRGRGDRSAAVFVFARTDDGKTAEQPALADFLRAHAERIDAALANTATSGAR